VLTVGVIHSNFVLFCYNIEFKSVPLLQTEAGGLMGHSYFHPKAPIAQLTGIIITTIVVMIVVY